MQSQFFPPPPRPIPAVLGALVATLSLHTTPALASASDRDAALEAWRAEHGESWQLDVDPKIEAGALLYSGIAEPASRPEDDAGFIDAAREFIRASSPLHGVDDATLVFDRLVFLPLSLIESSDKTTVRFAQEVRGVRVEGGYVNVLMDTAEGYLLSVQNTGLPGVETFDTDAVISAEGALALAFEQLLLDSGVRAEEISTPELVISQIDGETTRTPRLTWFVQASAWMEGQDRSPVSLYFNFDAQTGELVRARDALSHYDVSGTVTSLVTFETDALHEGSTTESKPMGRIHIFENETDLLPITTAAPDGTYTIKNYQGDGTVWVRYEGEVAPRVQNELGDEREESFPVQSGGGNDHEMNSTPSQYVTAQANAYYWITRMHDWIIATNPADDIWVDMVADGPTAYVNDPSDACNGSASDAPAPAVFLGPADGTTCGAACSDVICTNTASATIIAHETGHILRFLYGPPITFGGFSEGMGDVYALYLTDQVWEGENSCLNNPDCSGRKGDNAVRYCPDNPGTCYGQDHLDGEVLMGAFWKMRERLKLTHGAYGGHVADVLFNAWENAYDELAITPTTRTQLLTLDDGPAGIGNQGLVDGTPHWADIERGFADQGFPLYWTDIPSASPGILFSNLSDPGQTTNETGPYTITADIVSAFAPPIKSASILYRVNGGAFKPPIAMAQSGNTFTGTIPGQVSPAVIEYYLSATDSTVVGPGPAGQTAEYPLSIKVAMDATPDQFDDNFEDLYKAIEATPSYLRFFVGEKVTHIDEGFDPLPNPEWPHGADGSAPDDWQFGDPDGEVGGSWADPLNAFSGSNCAGNDLGTAGGDSVGGYEPEADNWLRTPAGDIDLTGLPMDTRTFLRFQRWLSVEDWRNAPNFLDVAEIRVVSNGALEARVWKNHRAITHVDNTSNTGAWIPFEIEITDAIDGVTQPQIEWRLTSNDSDQSVFGGWTIDDVEVFSIEAIP